MRKLLASFLLCSSICLPASALPGMKYKEAKNFYGNHKFLISESPTGKLTTPFFDLYRYLAGDQKITVMGSYSTPFCDCDEEYDHSVLGGVEVKYSLHEEGASEMCLQSKDPSSCYPKKMPHKSSFWARKSTKAKSLLKKIFTDQVAKDFSESKMIYSGDLFSDLDDPDLRIKDVSKTKIGTTKAFKGSRYYYFVEYNGMVSTISVSPKGDLSRRLFFWRADQKKYAKMLRESKKYTPASID